MGSVLWEERMVEKMLAKMKEKEPSISLEGASGTQGGRRQRVRIVNEIGWWILCGG